MCPLSRFLYLTRSIYFTGLSDGVSVYVHGQYAHLSLDTLNLHVYLSILYNLYDSMIVWWVLIRGYMILAYVQVLFSYVSLYKCVCRHFHVIPLCSRHDLITLRFHYPGPLLPSSLASQDYLAWYLRCVAGQPLSLCLVWFLLSWLRICVCTFSFYPSFFTSYGTLCLSCIDSIATWLCLF